MRKLTKTLAVVSLLAPVEGFPLGIGDIRLNSALNQNLNAEIALYLQGNERITDLKVSMASIGKFDEAGVPWTAALSSIKFAPVKKSNGTTVIELSSKEAIKEPFLSFLVKVAWPHGSQYKEFTVLVDPPATYIQPVIPRSTAGSVRSTNSGFNQPSRSSMRTSTRSSGSVATSGRVRVNDTLWKLARRVNKGRSSSVEQMMIALFEANPKAFYQNNVNNLLAGATLTVPNNSAVTRLSARQARAEFVRQNKAWRNQTTASTVTVSTPTTSMPTAPTGTVNQLKLLAPEQAKIDAQATVSSKNVEPLASVNDAAMGQGANAQLLARLEQMERKLAEMQVIMAYKDDELAKMQAAGKAAPELISEVTGMTEVAPVVVNDIATDVSTPAQKPVPIKPEISKPEPKPEVVEPKPKPVVDKASKTEAEDSSYFTWLAVIFGLIAILVGWLWRRKKIMEEATADESMFSSAFTSLPGAEVSEISQMGSIPVSDELSFQSGTLGESSILSEFTPSDFDAFETDQSEVDPISEADVYLAYGRYQQAEELMHQAIKDQPDRDECKLKLLEIYYANESNKDFEKYAMGLAAEGKDRDSDFWARVVEMGSELCPDLALFNNDSDLSAANVVSTRKPRSKVADDSVESIDGATEDSNSIDFDAGQIADDNIQGFDFDDETDSDDEATDEVEFDFDMSFDTDDSSNENQGEGLIEMDEMETKLDLARAYIDMGDEDAAKTIAEEVLSKGGDEQKQQAQKIIDSL